MRSPLAPAPSFAFAPCQLILSGSGRILALDQTARRQAASLRDESWEGRHLSVFLARLNPTWEGLDILNRLRHDTTYYAPWEAGPPPSPHGVEFHLCQAGSQLALMLTPTLDPHVIAADPSLVDLPPDAELNRLLFMRLKQAEDTLRIYTHHFPGVVFQQRADLSFSYIGPGFSEQFHLDTSPLEKHGSRFLDLIYEQDRDFYLAETQKRGARSQAFSLTYRLRLPPHDQIVYLLDVRTPRRLPSGLLLGYEGVWLDITRQHVAEKRLTSAAWKENLATLTSGLLHDFKNGMTGVCTLSELYCFSLAPDHPWHEGMNLIHQTAQNAQRTVQRMMDLNREQIGTRAYHNLLDLLRQQIDLLRLILPKHIQIDAHLPTAEWPVYLDEVGFRHLLLNLAINSRDACGETGRLTLRVHEAPAGTTIASDTPSQTFTTDTDGILLELSDNGCGIPPHQLPLVFDPFFTTKEISKGSGLGLYNVRLFLEEHHGRIALTSTPGHGTTAHVFLPLADFTEAAGAPEPLPNPNPTPATHRVALIAESPHPDLARHLQREGCHVLTLPNPAALHQLLATDGPPTLAVFIHPVSHRHCPPDLRARLLPTPRHRLVQIYPAGSTPDLSDDPHLFEIEAPPPQQHRRLALQIAQLLPPAHARPL